MPITIAIAILRAKLLLDIDLILNRTVVNRTIVYFAVTAILAGAFGALSTGAQLLLVELTGHRSDILALGVGVTFGPVRAEVQLAVNRTFGLAPGDPGPASGRSPRGVSVRHTARSVVKNTLATWR